MIFFGIKIEAGGILNNTVGILLLLSLFLCGRSYSQQQYKIPVGSIYKEFTNEPPDGVVQNKAATIIAYDPDALVLKIWQEIISFPQLKSAAFVRRISVKKAHVNNFWSTNSGGMNIIFYDPEFFDQFNGISNVAIDDLIRFSLLHELGHFMNHDIEQQIKSKQKEIEADLYACGVLCSMHKDKDSVIIAMLTLGSLATDALYPNKGERLKLIDSFFNNNNCDSNIIAGNKKRISPKKVFRNDSIAENYFKKGMEAYNEKKYQIAVSCFNQTIYKNPKHEDAYYYRGRANHMLKNYNLAIEDYSKTIFFKKFTRDLFTYKGLAEKEIGEYYQAIEDFNIAIDSCSALHLWAARDLYYYRGHCYLKINNCKQALEDLNSAAQFSCRMCGPTIDYYDEAKKMCNK